MRATNKRQTRRLPSTVGLAVNSPSAAAVVPFLIVLLLAAAVPCATQPLPNAVVEEFTTREVNEFVENRAATVAMLGRLRERGVDDYGGHVMGGAVSEAADGVSSSSPTRRASSHGHSPIRFHVDYGDLPADWESSSMNDTLYRRVREDILPLALAELGRRVGVKRPVEGNLRLAPTCISVYKVPQDCVRGTHGCTWYCATVMNTPEDPGTCGHTLAQHKWEYFGSYETCDGSLNCVTRAGSAGAPNADIILYVTLNDNLCGGGGALFGFARACFFDPLTNRPLAAYINFCPTGPANTLDIAAAVEMTVHELLHALYFVTPDLVVQFVDADRSYIPLGSDAVLGTNLRGDSVLKTPRLLQEANALYGCDNSSSSIDGVPLENRGGSIGIRGSHWKSSVVRGDIMLGTYSYVERRQFGPLSYAVMEDSGWYQPNWDTVGIIQEGRDAGCDLFTTECAAFKAEHPESDLFCTSRDEMTCSPNRRSRVRCMQNAISGCLQPRPSAYAPKGNTHCFDATNAELSDSLQPFFFGSEFGAFSRCMEVQVGLVHRIPGSNDSFSSQTDPFSDSNSSNSVPPQCYKMACTPDGLLQISIRNVTLDCPTGKMLNMSELHPEYIGGMLGPCPNNTEMCSTLSCPADCNANGQCVDGRCYCDMPWVGDDCGQVICTPHACGPDEMCDVATGLCKEGTEIVEDGPNGNVSNTDDGSALEALVLQDIDSLADDAKVLLYDISYSFLMDIPRKTDLSSETGHGIRQDVASQLDIPNSYVHVERYCDAELTILVLHPVFEDNQAAHQRFADRIEVLADTLVTVGVDGNAIAKDVNWERTIVRVEEARRRYQDGEGEVLGCSESIAYTAYTVPTLLYVLSFALTSITWAHF